MCWIGVFGAELWLAGLGKKTVWILSHLLKKVSIEKRKKKKSLVYTTNKFGLRPPIHIIVNKPLAALNLVLEPLRFLPRHGGEIVEVWEDELGGLHKFEFGADAAGRLEFVRCAFLGAQVGLDGGGEVDFGARRG